MNQSQNEQIAQILGTLDNIDNIQTCQDLIIANREKLESVQVDTLLDIIARKIDKTERQGIFWLKKKRETDPDDVLRLHQAIFSVANKNFVDQQLRLFRRQVKSGWEYDDGQVEDQDDDETKVQEDEPMLSSNGSSDLRNRLPRVPQAPLGGYAKMWQQKKDAIFGNRPDVKDSKHSFFKECLKISNIAVLVMADKISEKKLVRHILGIPRLEKSQFEQFMYIMEELCVDADIEPRRYLQLLMKAWKDEDHLIFSKTTFGMLKELFDQQCRNQFFNQLGWKLIEQEIFREPPTAYLDKAEQCICMQKYIKDGGKDKELKVPEPETIIKMIDMSLTRDLKTIEIGIEASPWAIQPMRVWANIMKEIMDTAFYVRDIHESKTQKPVKKKDEQKGKPDKAKTEKEKPKGKPKSKSKAKTKETTQELS